MTLEIVEMEAEHLTKLLAVCPIDSVSRETMAKAYFSAGSAAYCLLSDGEPVFAGGIVNLQWSRGEAWILPTPFFKKHLKTCFQTLKRMLPEVAARCHFRRVQAVCSVALAETLFAHLGFEYEGSLRYFGPSGERCKMFSRIFL
jgi:hypothetical protein